MKQIKHYIIIGIFFVIITGSLAHFLYDWSGNHYIVGLFVPINESIWEHMKLLFFPMLIYSAVMTFMFKDQYPCITSSLFFGIFTGTLLIPLLFYLYTFIIGKDIFILDIGIFILSVIIAFWLSCKLTHSCKSERYASLLRSLMCILLICFMLFTYHPPGLAIFQDPAIAQTGSSSFPSKPYP